MNTKALAAQQLSGGGQGRPGQQPEPCATGITRAAADHLHNYDNGEVRARVLAVVKRKTGDAGSSWHVNGMARVTGLSGCAARSGTG
jgi:hypothetical protein